MNDDKIIHEGDFVESIKNGVTRTRRLLVIGCGDGGCNIASKISQAIPDDCFVIAYNTTDRAMDMRQSNMRLTPFGIDGSGKMRSDATEVFKKKTGRVFMEKIMNTIGQMDRVDYILVIGTADGGTGSGTAPTMAKLLAKNLDTPVIIIGVYPSIKEDAVSQYNTIQWQKEITDSGLPYIIMDNNVDGPVSSVHADVNDYVAMIAQLIAGRLYGDTDISIIDNRNLYMLIQQMGNRIVIASSIERLSNQSSLYNHVTKILTQNYQPEPSRVKGIGIFVKGPKDVIGKADTALVELQEKYGQAVLKFSHIEISEDTRISILLSGCDEPAERLKLVHDKYDDIIRSSKQSSNVAGGLAEDMYNPLGDTKTKEKSTKIDFSILED